MKVVDMLYDQYGDNGPDQEQLSRLGKSYVDKNFPKVDSIKTATLIGAVGTAAPPKPAAAPKTASPARKPQ
jgi:hypothetical protein